MLFSQPLLRATFLWAPIFQVAKQLLDPQKKIDSTTLGWHHAGEPRLRSLFPTNQHWHALSARMISPKIVIKTGCRCSSSIIVHFLSAVKSTLSSTRNTLRTPPPEKSRARASELAFVQPKYPLVELLSCPVWLLQPSPHVTAVLIITAQLILLLVPLLIHLFRKA